MNEETLNAFREKLSKDNNHKTLISLIEMYNDLPRFAASNIVKKYNEELDLRPFKVDVRTSDATRKILHYKNGEDEYKIDTLIETDPKELYTYRIAVFKQGSYGHNTDWCKDFKSLNGFDYKDSHDLIRKFAFNEESKVIECVQAIIEETSEYLNSQSHDNK